MKTIMILLSVIFLTSCYKKYNCECVYEHSYHGLKEETQPITTSTKKEAKELCEEHGLGLYNDYFDCKLVY